MKIQIASDLHLEKTLGRLPHSSDFRSVEDRDVLVLAGDIGTHANAIRFVDPECQVSEVIYVPGNHEYYSMQMRKRTDEIWRAFANNIKNLHYLVGETVTIGGVRFWGGPWYSDLFGSSARWLKSEVSRSINDFRNPFNDLGQWNIHRHIEEHHIQTEQLRAHAGEVDVVITHWPPTKQATAPRFSGSDMNAYFVNDREDLVREIGAQAWISGHVHDAYDVVIGRTRVIGNPSGYPGEVPESKKFRPDRVIEVDPARPA